MPGVGTTHHVKIDGHYYMVRPGSYTKRQAPQFGARFTTGDPDYNNLSIWQHWAQRCWVGGIDAEEYADDAMYDQGVGVNTTEHEKVTLARDLSRGSGSNWTISTGTANADAGVRTCIFDRKLFVLTLPASTADISHLWQYDPATDGWTRITSLDAQNVCGKSIGTFDGKLFIGGSATGGVTGKLVYSSGALSSWTVVTNPSGLGASSLITSMRSFGGKFYVAYYYQIWRMKDDQTWDGNTLFYKSNVNGSDGIFAMETHLGFLYMLSRNGHVHRTDGNSTFDIWSWDGQTEGVAIKSFDGRLFILTYEYTNTANVGFGVLYQMSGSAVTQLKRWGHASDSTRIGAMTVYDRKLFYGASNWLGMGSRAGFGVAVYDPIEDAHSLIAVNGATGTYPRGVVPYNAYIVDDQIFFEGYLFAFVRGHGAFKTPYQPYDMRTAVRRYDPTMTALGAGAENGGWFTTSTYDAGTPGLRKLWRKVIVDYTLPANTTIIVDYSTNGGTSWVNIGTISTTGTRLRQEYSLQNIISVSFKMRFTLRTTTSSATPVILGYIVSYLPVPEPNWMWNFTIVLAEKMVLMDGTEEAVDTEAELTFLKDSFRTKQLLNFIDAEGTSWAASDLPGVIIYDIDIRLLDLTQPLEGEVNLTLLEAVETY